MDTHFKVPQIPLVSTSSLDKKIEVKRKVSSKTNGSFPQPTFTTQPVVGNETNREQANGQLNSSRSIEAKSSHASKTKSANLLPSRALPKLCSSCSQILIEYLTPLELYIKQIISLADGSQDSEVTDFHGTARHNAQVSIESHRSRESSLQIDQLSGEVRNLGLSAPQHHDNGHEQNISPDSASDSPSHNQSHHVSHAQHSTFPSSGSATSHQSFATSNNNRSISIANSNASQVVDQHNLKQEERGEKPFDQVNEQSHFVPVKKGESFEQSTYSNDHGSEEKAYVQEKAESKRAENSQFTSQPGESVQKVHATPAAEPATQLNSQSDSVHQRHSAASNRFDGPTQSQVQSAQDQTGWTLSDGASTLNESHLMDLSSGKLRLSQSDSVATLDEHFEATEEVSSETCPYAYVTIAYNNLSAVNAILLANSIQLYNNKVLNILENDALLSKRITTRYHIPTVILVCDSINNQLRDILYQVFDKVVESKYQEAVLLNDESLGIQQYKIHLWKELAFQYEKCIFLESFTMVVGQVSNLFMECRELSACVDCLFPDNFECSVFVFEPNMDTYKELLKYGLQQLQLNEANEDALQFDTLDEMTLLNQFFAPKWKKLSFIYNFVRNDLTYTQVPAYFKYGDNIRVVNFGSTTGQHLFYSSQQAKSDKFNSPLQPWNYKFDLAKAQLEDEPFHSAQVDNYCKFYLRCFIRRVWPLLSQSITPHLLTLHSGRSEWTIFELIQILGRGAGTESIAFEQNPVSFRRKKSWAVEPTLKSIVIESNEDNNQKEKGEQSDEATASEAIGTDQPASEQSKAIESVSELASNPKPAAEASKPYVFVSENEKRQWEDGRVDWMGEHQSDKIIHRLKTIIKK